jgi:type VI protein secretion system component Hcp
MDFSSPSLLTHLGKQRVFSSLGLNLVQVNSLGVSVPLATLTLINAVLTGYSLAHGSLGSSSTISWSGSDGDEACKEEVTFEYGGLQIKYLGGIPDVQSGVRIRGRKL